MTKTILITGGTGKIGGQLVHHFYVQGWRVFYTTRRENSHDLLTERFGLTEVDASRLRAIVVDFYDLNATTIILEAVAKEEVTVLVNNARDLASLRIEEDGLTDRKYLADEYLIDVIMPYELATGLLSQEPCSLRRVINISSIYGIVPFNPNLYDNYERSAPIQYSLAKAALNHLTRELSIRYRGRCQVNTVSYGGVIGRVDDDFLARYAALCPEGNMLTEAQTVGPVAFLASPESTGITGQNIIQDGGWTVW